MTNIQISKLLRNISAAYVIKNERKYRFQIIAYQKAADAIENSTTEIQDLVKEDGLQKIPGVGESISSHLIELFKTGRVKHFECATKDIPASVFTLLDIPTLGPKKAYRLTKEFKLNNPKTVIENLEQIAKSGKIASLEGFGEKSQEDILRAISEYKKGQGKTKRMVLSYAWELAENIIDYLGKSKDVLKVYPLGSLRRMVSTIGDIDIAVATKKPKEVIKYFTSYPYKKRIIEQGEAGASILISSGKQVDLRTQSPDCFGSLLQHLTGSKNHNIHLREYALKKGLSLSEYGIKKKMENGKWKMENYKTEKEFYESLGMDWIPPEIREDTGEIELAVKHRLPKLVELNDVKGDLHIHSDYPLEPSHDLGKDSMKKIIKKAIALKYEYLGFSEHNPSVSKHTNEQIYSILSKRKEKIEQLKLSNKNIRILNLLEVDILARGDLSLDNKSLTMVDAIIVSIHSSFNITEKEMTERVLNGLSHPKAKILAHPTGRLLNQRNGYDLFWEQIFDLCKKEKKALEINAWPNRLDLTDLLVKNAVACGVKMVINTDSHSAGQMDLMKYGIAVAKRGWAKKDDILNSLEYNDFIEWLKS